MRVSNRLQRNCVRVCRCRPHRQRSTTAAIPHDLQQQSHADRGDAHTGSGLGVRAGCLVVLAPARVIHVGAGGGGASLVAAGVCLPGVGGPEGARHSCYQAMRWSNGTGEVNVCSRVDESRQCAESKDSNGSLSDCRKPAQYRSSACRPHCLYTHQIGGAQRSEGARRKARLSPIFCAIPSMEAESRPNVSWLGPKS